MSKSLSYEIDASDAIHFIEGMLEAMNDYGVPLEGATKFLKLKINENFEGGGKERHWAPLSPVTAAYKAEHALPPEPLVRYGGLQAAVAFPQTEIATHSASVGIHNDVAPFHQYGSTKVHLPKREIVFEPKGFGDMFARRCVAHILPKAMTRELMKAFG